MDANMEERRQDLDEEKVGIEPEVLPDAASQEVPSYMKNMASRGLLARIRYYEDAMDRKLGVESHGVTRKRPEDRDPSYGKWSNQAVMFLLWLSATLNLSCFTTGFLGWEFGLDLSRSIALVVFATLLGAMVTGWCATMGPATGLRQVSISRYSLGWWPSKLVAALNVVEQVGWSAVGSITGGIALSAVSDGRVGPQLGVVIVAVLGFVVSFVGLKAVFQYEKYAGLVLAVVFIIMYGEVGSHADLKTKTELTGANLSGSALTLFAVFYGSSASWCSIVSDYYVEYPVNTSKVKVFVLTTLGIALPTIFGMALGAICASALNNNQAWSDAYNVNVGTFISVMIHPRNFAKFLLVLLALSSIAMIALNIYSAGLSVQQFARPLGLIPRFFWTSLMFVAVILLALVGRNKLADFLENFLSLLGYWNTSFFVILCVEHYVFRGGLHGFSGYDLESWNNPSRLPIGFAGGLAFAAGIAGCVLGMSETWYVGVLAAKIGETSGDIGNELAFLFSLVVYPPARWLEYKYVGR